MRTDIERNVIRWLHVRVFLSYVQSTWFHNSCLYNHIKPAHHFCHWLVRVIYQSQ